MPDEWFQISQHYTYDDRGAFCEHCCRILPEVIRFQFGARLHFICESCLEKVLKTEVEEHEEQRQRQ